MKKIYLAGGCFWGVQHFYSLIKGIIKTNVGYANSDIINPKYEDLKNHLSSGAETVEILYDEKIITLEELLDLFFLIINPFSIDKQGHDIGHQYRSGIYYLDDKEKDFIISFINNKQKLYQDKIMVEVLKLNNFYIAEEYHQDYLIKNPHGYCHIDNKMMKFAKEYKPKNY